MIVEDILKESGDFGRAQWCLLSLFSIINIFSAFHYFAQTFITLDLAHSSNNNDNGFVLTDNLTKNGSDEWKSLKSSTWTFQTVTDELNWSDEEAWKPAFVQSTFFMGSVLGTLVLGSLSDSYGRIPLLIAANVLAILGNLLTVFLDPNLWSLSVARFVAGTATDTNFFMMYIIVMEYIKPNMRTFGLNLSIGLWYCIGCLLTPWLAVLSKTWRVFLLSFSIPNILIPFCCFFVPESAQWLLSVGRTDDALAAFKKIADFNGKQISSNSVNYYRQSVNANKTNLKTASVIGLFKTPCLRRKTCILIFKTIVLSLCYDAISRNVKGLGLDPFTVFTITSASILPSSILILLLQDRLGRKILAVSFLLLTALFNFCQGFILVFLSRVTFLAALIGLFSRFAVNIAYNSGTQYAAELIPTQVRGQGLAVMHAVGYGATFFSSQILFLSEFWVAAPQAILGFLSLAGAVFCIFLPETLNQSLPITLEDGETFGENQNIWNFLKRKKKLLI